MFAHGTCKRKVASFHACVIGRFQKYWTDHLHPAARGVSQYTAGRSRDLAHDEYIDSLRGYPVHGQWYRGATPAGFPSSMSAFENENRWHHKKISATQTRQSIPDWLTANENWLREKSEIDAKLTWQGDPIIPTDLWVDAGDLLSLPGLMEYAVPYGTGLLLPQQGRFKQWRQVC